MNQFNKDTASSLAIVVAPVPPQDSTPPASSGCAYQVEIAYHEYQCMTAQQYQDYKNQAVNLNWGLFWLAYGALALLAIAIYLVVNRRKKNAYPH